MNNLSSFFLVFISVFIFCSCASEMQLSTSHFSKRKYTKGRHISLKNHFLNSFDSSKDDVIKTETLITQADKNRLTRVDHQAVLELKSRQKKYDIKQAVNELNEDKDNQVHFMEKFPHNDSVEIVTTSGKVYRGVAVKSFDGYFIILPSEKAIFISTNEIKQLTKLSSSVHQSEKITEPKARQSLIFALLGITFLPFIGSIIAIVLAKKSISKIDENPKKYKGRGLAIGGLTLGVLGFIYVLLIAVWASLVF